MAKRRKKSKNKNKKISGKLKIETRITDEKGNVRIIEEEIDVNEDKNFSDSEKKTIEMGERLTTIIFEERLKKKKKWRFRRLFLKIKRMLGMERKWFK